MSEAAISSVPGPTRRMSMSGGKTKGGIEIASNERSSKESGLADGEANEAERDWTVELYEGVDEEIVEPAMVVALALGKLRTG